MLRKLTFLVALLLVSQVVLAQDNANVVRAIWTPEILVIINISGDGVDLSQLELVGADGGVVPLDWVMREDENGVSYSLYNVRPGSCLLLYPADTVPAVPSTVSCTRIVGEFTPVNLNDIIWAVNLGSFDAAVAGETTATCSLTSGTSCDIPVNPANTNTEPLETEAPDVVEIDAIWTTEIFVMINSGDFGADFSGLMLDNETGEINASDWVIQVDDQGVSYDNTNVRPGGCFIAWVGVDGPDTVQPALPENVECTRVVGLLTLENPLDQVWAIDYGGFTPTVDGTAGEACSVDGSTACSFTVPNGEIVKEEVEATPEASASAAEVRAIWNPDILVLINVSGDGVDLTQLSLENAEGAVLPENWVIQTDANGVSYDLSNVRPGSCLIGYLGVDGPTTAQPELPAGVSCTRTVGIFTAANPVDIVWNLPAGGFVPVYAGTSLARCSVDNATSCDIDLP